MQQDYFFFLVAFFFVAAFFFFAAIVFLLFVECYFQKLFVKFSQQNIFENICCSDLQ